MPFMPIGAPPTPTKVVEGDSDNDEQQPANSTTGPAYNRSHVIESLQTM